MSPEFIVLLIFDQYILFALIKLMCSTFSIDHYLFNVAKWKWGMSNDHLEENDSAGEQVSLHAYIFIFSNKLRTHIGIGPFARGVHSILLLASYAVVAEAEISDLQAVVLTQQDIPRLHV